MTLVPRLSNVSGPMYDVGVYFNEMEKMFSKMFDTAESYPVTNIYLEEESSKLVFEVAITGFKNDEIDVTVNDGKLVITGKKTSTSDSIPKRYITRKIATRDFTQKYIIPNVYNVSSVDANIADGILKISIDKKQEDIKKIDIKY